MERGPGGEVNPPIRISQMVFQFSVAADQVDRCARTDNQQPDTDG
jgi:hypothetical protein